MHISTVDPVKRCRTQPY